MKVPMGGALTKRLPLTLSHPGIAMVQTSAPALPPAIERAPATDSYYSPGAGPKAILSALWAALYPLVLPVPIVSLGLARFST